MQIWLVFAANFTPSTGKTGGATALSIMLGVGLLYLLVYVGQKKWRRRKLRREGNDELRDQ
jgi:hypothetical protein